MQLNQNPFLFGAMVFRGFPQNPWHLTCLSSMLTKTRSRRTEIRTEPNLMPSLTVYTKRYEAFSNIPSVGASYAGNPSPRRI